MSCATQPEGEAEAIGRHLAHMALRMRSEAGPDCLITGGEPTVRLVPPSQRGLGGRNQQLVLAAMEEIVSNAATLGSNPLDGLAIISGGTDGEDGPTDAAGALIDAQVWRSAAKQGLDPASFLRRNDAYHFFAPLGALIQTGPTHTNVCDLRVVVVSRAG
jgi:glycerate 2-kinase